MRHWEAIQQHSLREREDDGVGSDAEGERADGYGGEAGAAAEHADGVAEVVAELVEEAQAEGGADVFAMLVDGAELDAGAAQGLGRSEAGALEVGGAAFDVELELVGDLGLALRAVEKRGGDRSGVGRWRDMARSLRGWC